MSILRNMAVCGLAVFFIALTCGVNFSYIWCKQGSRWVLGSKMPECKLAKKTSVCPFSKAECGHAKKTNQSADSDNHRNKKTFTVLYKFIAEINNSTSLKDYSAIALSVGDFLTPGNGFTETLNSDYISSIIIHGSDPPPLERIQFLAELQIFRI